MRIPEPHATAASLYGSYCSQAGYSQLQAAKKANPNYMERFAIYRREQEHLARTAQTKGNGESTLDLVSYVEFQRNFRCAPSLSAVTPESPPLCAGAWFQGVRPPLVPDPIRCRTRYRIGGSESWARP